jgi:hypothetical protein
LPSVSLGHSAIFFNFLKLILPSANARHSTIVFILENHIWLSAPHGTRQNIFFGPKFFLGPCDSISNSILKFGAILTFFDIFH